MTCDDCEARFRLIRDAVLEGKLLAAAGHAVKGAVEMTGLIEKTGVEEEAETKATRRSRKSDDG